MSHFSDKVNAIQDIKELFQIKLIYKWLFNSFDIDLENNSNRDMKQAIITDLKNIILICNVLSIN